MDFLEINLNELNQILQDAITIKHIHESTIDALKEENQFLADTLTQNKLGKITEERRDIKERLRQLKQSSEEAIKEADNIKGDYECKLEKLTIMIQDIKKKQSDIDVYINNEAENKISNKIDELENKYKKKNSKLQKEYQNKETLLNTKVCNYKKYMIISIIISVICFIVMILNFIF